MSSDLSGAGEPVPAPLPSSYPASFKFRFVSAPSPGGPSASIYVRMHDMIYSITSCCGAVIGPGAFWDCRPSVQVAPYSLLSAAIAALVRSTSCLRRHALARARGDLALL